MDDWQIAVWAPDPILLYSIWHKRLLQQKLQDSGPDREGLPDPFGDLTSLGIRRGGEGDEVRNVIGQKNDG